MTFFVICMGVGVVFLVITAALGGLGDLGFHFDIGGHDLGLGGAGAHVSPLSPILIAFFLTAFGGMGIVSMTLFQVSFDWSILISLVTALALAVLVYVGLFKVFEMTQGGVEVNVADMVGREAEVITGIPQRGVGEIALITSGGRLNGPARSEDGDPIPFSTIVRIVKVVGNTYIVKRDSAPVPASTPPPPKQASSGGEDNAASKPEGQAT